MSCSLPDYSPFANYFYTAVGQYALFFCLYWLDLAWLDLRLIVRFIDRSMVSWLAIWFHSVSFVSYLRLIDRLIGWLVVGWLASICFHLVPLEPPQDLDRPSLAHRATPRGGPRSLSSAAVLAALGNFCWPDVVMWDWSEWWYFAQRT